MPRAYSGSVAVLLAVPSAVSVDAAATSGEPHVSQRDTGPSSPGSPFYQKPRRHPRGQQSSAVFDRSSPTSRRSHVVTKLDESCDCGSLRTLLARTRRAISYPATGRDTALGLEARCRPS
jgi:hypothetical protein